MRCILIFLHVVLCLLSIVILTTCFRSEEAEGKLTGPSLKLDSFEEGNTNHLIRQHQVKRSIPEEDNTADIASNIMNQNIVINDLMAMTSPVRFTSPPGRYREKRSKHSKNFIKKHSKRSDITKPVNTKDELMNILGAIRTAKHHKLSRNDIRKLAKKAFARLKLKKSNSKKKNDKIKENSTKTAKARETEKKEKEKKTPKIDNKIARKETIEKPEHKGEIKNKVEKKPVKAFSSSPDKASKIIDDKSSKTAKEDEKAFSNIFDDAVKPKPSEFAEDISKLGDTAKISQMLSDDSTSHNNNDASLEMLANKKSTETNSGSKPLSNTFEQEITKALDSKSVVNKKDDMVKKSTIPSSEKNKKITTLEGLLAKANKNKVPKKFLEQFPVGLRMIAWRELLEKKQKELKELEQIQSQETATKKETNSDLEKDRPVTVNIDIVPGMDKSFKATSNLDGGEDKHHIASHVKYLQKHLSGAQDLRRLISRALIGHCKATGKRILKAFVAMDKALARAQNIAIVIGKKFKVDGSKIENIVVNKEDEVVESFLRDIFSNFTP